MARYGTEEGASRIAGDTRLSRIVLTALAAILVCLWALYAWLSWTERDNALRAAHDHMADVAAAYGEHASTLMEMGIPIRVRGMPGGQSMPGSTLEGEKSVAQFRGALDLQDISVWIYKDGPGPSPGQSLQSSVPDEPEFRDSDHEISAIVQRPSAGIAVIATMSTARALSTWHRAALFEGLLVGLISLLCAAAIR